MRETRRIFLVAKKIETSDFVIKVMLSGLQSDGFILHVSVMPLTMRYAGPWVHHHAMSLPELKLRHRIVDI
jgi:hypothetical protein